MRKKDTACYCKCCCNYIPAVSLRVSLLCFLHDIFFGTLTLRIHVFVYYVMSGNDRGRLSKSSCKKPLGNMVVSTSWQISRGHAISSTTGVWNVLWHIWRTEEVMRECDITIPVLSRLTVLLTWAASLGWTSAAVNCCNIYLQEVPRTCRFLHIILFVHRFCSSQFSNCRS